MEYTDDEDYENMIANEMSWEDEDQDIQAGF